MLPTLFSALILGLSTSQITVAWAQQTAFDCHISLDSKNYDLTDLAGGYIVSRERDSTPTTIVDDLRFNLCADLTRQEGVPDDEQCPSGTRACLVKTNKKSGQSDRVFAVIPLTKSSQPQPLAVAYPPDSNGRAPGLTLSFAGPAYPASGPTSTPQGFNLSLLCDTSAHEPVFVEYTRGYAHVEWSTPVACGSNSDGGNGGSGGGDKEGSPPGTPTTGGDAEEESGSVGSGLGVFFLLLIVAFMLYFALGAYYNYTTYGASGADLIPHRDFWREVPFMARDVLSHLCGNIRQHRASSRTGYISV